MNLCKTIHKYVNFDWIERTMEKLTKDFDEYLWVNKIYITYKSIEDALIV